MNQSHCKALHSPLRYSDLEPNIIKQNARDNTSQATWENKYWREEHFALLTSEHIKSKHDIEHFVGPVQPSLLMLRGGETCKAWWSFAKGPLKTSLGSNRAELLDREQLVFAFLTQMVENDLFGVMWTCSKTCVLQP
eukprot:2707650-Amphidinium_carterae.2